MKTLTDDDIRKIAEEEGVPAKYALAIADKEDSGDTDVSSAGAVGRFQLLPKTFKSVHPEGDINNPEDNARAGIRYVGQALNKTGGDFEKASAYYYAGPAFEAKVALDKFYIENKKAGESAETLSRLGINTSDLDNTIAQIATELNSDFQRAQAMRKDIIAKQSVGLFDDPLQHIINQFTINSDIRAHNAVLGEIASKKQFVDQSTQIAQHVAQVNATKFTTTSIAGAQAAAELLRNSANEKALEMQDKMMKWDYDSQVRTLNVIQSQMTAKEAELQAEDRRGARADAKKKADLTLQSAQLDDAAVVLAGNSLGMKLLGRKDLDKKPKQIKEAVEYVMANDGGIGKDPFE